MLNNLLGTTALAGLVFSFLSDAHAADEVTKKKQEGKLTLEISGRSSFNAIMGSQSQKTMTLYPSGQTGNAPTDTPPEVFQTNNQSGMFTVDGARLGFGVFGKTAPGMEFGFNITLTGNTATRFSVRENYLTLKTSFGTVLLGDTSGVEDRMAFGGRDTQVGTGGIDGNFTRFVLVPMGVTTTVDLGYYGDTGDATKVTYLTPRLEGFQLGVSYTPDSKHEGEAKLDTAFNPEAFMPTPYERNSFSAGLNYVQNFDNGLAVSLSLTGLAGETQPERPNPSVGQSLQRNQTRAGAIGGLFEYDKFSLGLQYIDSGKSGQFTTNRQAVNPGQGGLPLDYVASNARAAQVFDVGVGYNYTPLTKFSLGYLTSSRKTGFANYKARGTVLTAGVQHKMAEGFVVYLEGANHSLKNPASPYEARLRAQSLNPIGASAAVIIGNVSPSQRANSVILGTKIQF